MKGIFLRKVMSLSLVSVLVLSLMTSCAGMTKVEYGEMTGELHLVREDLLIVENAGVETEVKTNGDTKYYLGEDDHLSVKDIINVKYHTKGKELYADRVAIVKYAKRELEFSGEITEMEAAGITVTDETMSVFFITNDGTEVSGELNKGDMVDVVYTGNINEYPYAAKINVTEEKKETKTAVINGNISDFSEDSIQISIDSATSCRIGLNMDTKFTGVSKYMNTGDSVKITYTGDLKDNPVATEVEILKKADNETHKVNGKIKQITDKYVVLNTDKNSYMIFRDKNTKYTGAKMEEGCDSEITYTGKLSNKPMATAIYCAELKVFYKVTFNDGQGHVIKEQQVEKGKDAKAPSNPTRSGYTFKGWDKDFKKVKSDLKVTAQWKKNADPKPTPPTPTPVTKYKVTFTDGQGTTLSEQEVEEGKAATAPAEPSREGYKFTGWDADFSKIDADLTVNALWEEIKPTPNTYKVTFTDGQGGIISEQDVEEGKAAEAPADPIREGYTFKGWDADFSNITADLTVNATWEENPAPEPEPTPEPEPEPEPEPAPAPEPAPEPEPEPEPTPPEEVIVSAQGIIVDGNADKMTIVIDIDGKTIELKGNSDTKIAGGYFPKARDKVQVKYVKEDSTLKEIKLVEKAPEEPTEEPADDGSNG